MALLLENPFYLLDMDDKMSAAAPAAAPHESDVWLHHLIASSSYANHGGLTSLQLNALAAAQDRSFAGPSSPTLGVPFDVDSSSAKDLDEDTSSPTPKRRKSTITIAAVSDAIRKVEESDEVVKEELEKATLFAGKTMSKEDLKKLQVKLEKNRQLARESRKKKKAYMALLEDKLKTYEQRIVGLQHQLHDSERRNVSLLSQLAHLTNIAAGNTAVSAGIPNNMSLGMPSRLSQVLPVSTSTAPSSSHMDILASMPSASIASLLGATEISSGSSTPRDLPGAARHDFMFGP